MPPAASPPAAPPRHRLDDPLRLAALRETGLVPSAGEPVERSAQLEHLTRLATHLLGASIALVSLVDDERQMFPAHTGLSGWPAELGATPLAYSFCQHVVRSGEPLVVEDARAHPLVCHSPTVHELGMATYCGVPLVSPDGQVVGSLCVLDAEPRAWTTDDVQRLTDLAAAAGAQIALRVAHRRLAEREARLALIHDHAQELIFLLRVQDDATSADGGAIAACRFESVNAAYLDVFGLTHDAVVGRTMAEVLPAEALAQLRPIYEALVRTREMVRTEKEVAASGRRLTLETTLTPVLDAGGRCTHVLGVERDVTARRRAERALVEGEARHRELVNSLPLVVYQVEPEPPFAPTFVSAGVASFGYTRDEWMATPDRWLCALHPEDRDRVVAETAAALAERRAVEYEYRLIGKDGTVHWVHDRGAFLVADDIVIAWQGVMLDVTAQRGAEAALRASEARFRGLSAASPVGVFEAAPDGMLTYANSRFAAIFAAAPCDLLGLHWLSRVHGDDVDALTTEWMRASDAGREWEQVFRLRVPGDAGVPEVRWVHARSAVLRDDAGVPVSIVGTVEDVSARVASDAATRRLTAILEASPDMVATATPDGRIEYLNTAGRRMLGLGPAEDALPASGLTLARLQPQLAPGGTEHWVLEQAVANGVWHGETVLHKGDGRTLPVEEVLLAHRASDGSLEYLSMVMRDITERQQTEATLKTFALLDELTGLYNRRGFMALAEREWQRAITDGAGIVVAYADLDRFKQVNDRHGHAAGDLALQTMARALRGTFREADVLGRLGGDEFVAIARCGAGQSPVQIARQIRTRLEATLQTANAAARLAGRGYDVECSIGIATISFQDGVPGGANRTTLAALMAEADEALYQEKRARRGGEHTGTR